MYAAISGFGQTGPQRLKPVFDVVVQAMSGAMSVTGEEGGPPVKPGLSLGDIGAGMFAAIGVLAALQERERSGRGQQVDVSMLDSQVALLENAFARYFAPGETPRALGTRHPTATPFEAFPTRDGYIAVAVSFNVENAWPLFAAIIGRPELIDDPRFATASARTRNRAQLEPLIVAALRQRSTAEWLEELEAVGIACGPVLSIAEAAALPLVLAREMLVETESAGGAPLTLVGPPVKLSRTPAAVRGRAPRPGEHTRSVLATLLGLSEPEIEAAFASGAVAEGQSLPEEVREG